ncbi:glycoside hydrolase family 19 protein [Caulobacter hibisci]|uniref:Glycoside hydrolase family 19 catalytic domain-containing protein n=1 Tax=Caulobacter hibisci TaxID=2035993 RepID=A0ABS0SS08_9CAUL|nr:glycoside hydrolase family 19 protein [Caulobacter hibisci]MBI1682369.1 hypothetical protein [Caulobacter hibisci]
MTGLTKPKAFFDYLRANDMLGPVLTADEVEGLNVITAAAGLAGWPASWTAYALATAYHETAHTMQPVKEIGGPDYFRRRYDISGQRPDIARTLGNTQIGDGAKYAGRGYVQVTGRANYDRARRELGQPLVDRPDLAMNDAIAAAIMVKGMAEGWFTGRSLKSYLTTTTAGTRAQFVEARRIINGQDRAGDIADYALAFQKALQAGGWA